MPLSLRSVPRVKVYKPAKSDELSEYSGVKMKKRKLQDMESSLISDFQVSQFNNFTQLILHNFTLTINYTSLNLFHIILFIF